MADPIIIIDPGHGGKDSGGGNNDHFLEKDMTLDISLYQYKRFQELGVPVSMTRTEDITLDSSTRTKIVRSSGAEYCISNHINAAGSSTARGVETIYSVYSEGELARAIFNELVSEGIPGRRSFTRAGANNRDYYFMHRETGSVETIIIEYGFATNPNDSELLRNHWRRYAEAVVRVFCEFINHPYNKPTEAKDRSDSGTNDLLPSIQEKVSVEVYGNDLTGYLIEDKTYVEVRRYSELHGDNISWNGQEKRVIIEKESEQQ